MYREALDFASAARQELDGLFRAFDLLMAPCVNGRSLDRVGGRRRSCVSRSVDASSTSQRSRYLPAKAPMACRLVCNSSDDAATIKAFSPAHFGCSNKSLASRWSSRNGEHDADTSQHEKVRRRFAPPVHWSGDSIYARVAHYAAVSPDVPAIHARWGSICYRDLVAAADRLAASLHDADVRAGGRVAVWMPSRAEVAGRRARVFP